MEPGNVTLVRDPEKWSIGEIAESVVVMVNVFFAMEKVLYQ